LDLKIDIFTLIDRETLISRADEKPFKHLKKGWYGCSYPIG